MRSDGFFFSPTEARFLTFCQGDGKDGLQSQWYREMHHRIHQQPDTDVGYIQVQYTRKSECLLQEKLSDTDSPRPSSLTARFPYDGIAGYTSEPEQDFQARGTRALAHDFSSVRPEKSEANEPVKYTLPVYRNAPGKIENYLPGKSSVATRKSCGSSRCRAPSSGVLTARGRARLFGRPENILQPSAVQLGCVAKGHIVEGCSGPCGPQCTRTFWRFEIQN
ncbi:unnamed protein product [Notodromas monacha]|uniref:Uncharacterized protein n=1 Tax=Notodromas monacha TaxID=399045 RepID=A0A7R9BRH9_9CRUS|nr:unnamed protein product [Notodromas monacha]CAG0920341.1 unnamed protein product [Notodromas monacha]